MTDDTTHAFATKGSPLARCALVVWALSIGIATLSGCASPAKDFDRRAAALGLSKHWIDTARFRHAVYTNAAWRPAQRVHIYLGGDGTPFLDYHRVAADPTPRRALALHLMALDPNPSAYLGRPCYHGLATLPPCRAPLWTSARYGDAVVESMSQALDHWLERFGGPRVVLIGHSGGGALAMLLAARRSDIDAIVTIAANLDLHAWTSAHDYSALDGSIDPASLDPLDIAQWHFIGQRDRNITVTMLDAVLHRQTRARRLIEPTYDHHCCWRREWPARLATILTQLDEDRALSGDINQ